MAAGQTGAQLMAADLQGKEGGKKHSNNANARRPHRSSRNEGRPNPRLVFIALFGRALIGRFAEEGVSRAVDVLFDSSLDDFAPGVLPPAPSAAEGFLCAAPSSTARARCAKVSEHPVSDAFDVAALTLTNMSTFELPPRLS